MARSRNIKPGFFANEELAELPYETRLLFIGLWTLADREGRLEDRPKRIKAALFPYDSCDIDPMLVQLQSSDFIVRYEVEGMRFMQITNFVKHQDPHYKERASEIPPPDGHSNLIQATNVTRSQRARILERDDYKCQECGSETALCIDHVIPVSRGGDSSDENLQVLCNSCNTKKGNRLEGELRGVKKSKHNYTSVLTRANVGSNLNQQNSGMPSDSLIPDSFNLIPDSGLLGEPPQAAPSPKAKKAAKKAVKTPMPEGFCISESVRKWAQQKGHQHLERHFESFVAKVEANGYTYANWDAAFRNAITDDWAKVRQLPRGSPPTYESAKDKSRRETYAALTGQNHEQRTIIDIN